VVSLKNLSARGKWLAGIICALVVVSLVASAIVVVVPDEAPLTPPPIEGKATEETLVYLASKEFAAEPVEVRARYIGEAKKAGVFDLAKSSDSLLTEAQRRQLKRNIASTFPNKTNERVKKYFKLPPEQRVAFLDKMIDERQKKKNSSKKPGGDGKDDGRSKKPDGGKDNSPKRGGKGGFTPQGLKHVLENLSAEERSRTLEFKRDVVNRMRERGIQSW
jgi:hypothetical protein